MNNNNELGEPPRRTYWPATNPANNHQHCILIKEHLISASFFPGLLLRLRRPPPLPPPPPPPAAPGIANCRSPFVMPQNHNSHVSVCVNMFHAVAGCNLVENRAVQDKRKHGRNSAERISSGLRRKTKGNQQKAKATDSPGKRNTSQQRSGARVPRGEGSYW